MASSYPSPSSLLISALMPILNTIHTGNFAIAFAFAFPARIAGALGPLGTG